MKKNQNAPRSSEHPPVIRGGKCGIIIGCQRIGCCFLHINPKKLLYTVVANPARGLLNREKRTKEEVWQHTPPPRPHCSVGEKKIITRRIYMRYAGLGRSRVRTKISSARRLGTRPMSVASQNSTLLPSAITSFPASLLLSSPGHV